MAYGTIKVDTITFTAAGVDTSVTISGLVQNPTFSGNITVTGTVSGNTIEGQTVSGATVTGDIASFTTVTGGVATITSGVFALGTDALPSLTFTGDLNTGIYSPGADQVAISTSGAQRLVVDASGTTLLKGTERLAFNTYVSDSNHAGYIGRNTSTGALVIESQNAGGGYPMTFRTNSQERLRITDQGLVGVGTSSPGSVLDVRFGTSPGTDNGNGTDALRVWTTNSVAANAGGAISLGGTSGAGQGAFGQIAGRKTNATSEDYAGYLQFATNTSGGTMSERMRIDSSGRLLVGTSSARSSFFNSTNTAVCQIEGTSGTSRGSISIVNNNTDGNQTPYLILGKSNGSVLGSNTIVANDTYLGIVSFQGADGSEFVEGASIHAQVDGTPGANDLPTRLVFSTTADGQPSPTERMRISQSGICSINTTLAENSAYFDGKLRVVNSGSSATFSTTGAAGALVVSQWHQATTGDNLFTTFGTEGTFTLRGTIDYNRAAGQVRYNVTSDRRLKSNIQPAASALDALSAIQVRAYKWTETDYQVSHGFIAQELYESVPDAVKTGDNDEEVTNPWAVDNAKLVPLLTKALQEALAKIETLEARLTAAGI